MAWYGKALVKNIPPGSNDPRITPRLVILHVAASNGDSLYDYFKSRSGGVESHFYVRKTGVIEQYRDTAYQADANMKANDFAVSIETEGLAAGEWTPEQLASIKALLSWLHVVHAIPLVVPTAWNGSGVGYHILFMQEWAGGPRSCPGPDRIKQFNSILVPWMKNGEEVVALDQTDAQAVWTGYAIVKDTRTGATDAPRVAPSALLEYTAGGIRTLTVQVGALSSAVKALSTTQGLSPDEVLAVVREETAKGVAAALAGMSVTLKTQ